MSRKEFFALGGAGAAVAGLSLTGTIGGRRGGPNLLVIMTDDQPYYTVTRMKAVRELIGNRGMTFSPNAYVSTPICGPARATLLTGRYSHNTGLTRTAGAYEDLRTSDYESDTIATRLGRAGYRTYFGGKYTNGYDGGAVPPGWDDWFAMVESEPEKAGSFLYHDGSGIRRYYRSVVNETDVLGADAERFVRDRSGSSVPWFAYVCPHAPHSPYYPAPRHDDQSSATPPGGVPSSGEKDLSDKPAWVRAEAPYTGSERRRATRVYRGKLGEIQEVDDLVRRLMEALDQTGQQENTFVFFVTDNGYLLGEHGLHRKNLPYEEASRTPFIVRGPDLRAGSRSDAVVSHVDLPTTLLDLAGAPWADLDGRSLAPVFSSGGWPSGWREEVLIEDLGRGWNMLRTPGWAYVEWDTGDKELYDMNNDRHQLHSLHARSDKADLMVGLSARLDALKACSGASCRSADNG
jgi:arylsulfatase A-like enzyme